MEKNNTSLNNNLNSNSYYEGNDFFLDYTEEKEDRDRITTEMVESARKRLKLAMNPQIVEETKEQLRENNQTLETYKDNPLLKYAGIDTNEKLEANKKLKEYLNVAQYNSSQNLFKNGASDILLPYIDNNGVQKAIELNGNQFITEDTKNIYIREEDGNEIIIPKQKEEEYSIKDKYTKYEQEQLRKNQYAYLTDEQWAEELTKVKKEYITLSKLQTERMLALQADIPDNLLKEIDDLDTIGVEELMYLTGIKERQEPLIESAMLKQKTGDKLNEEELNALWTRKYINYAIQRRGVAYGAEAFTGIVGNIKNNVSAIASTAITDAGLYLTLKGLGALSPHGTGIAVIGSMIKLAKKFNNYRKAHKYINYGYNALKYTGLTMASAKLDTLARAHIVDRAMGDASNLLFNDPTYFRTETKEERLRQKRNNRILEFTEKGGLFTRGLSESMEQFLNYQDNVEQFNEAWSERFVDGVVDTITGFIPIPKKIRNSLFAKVLKKINNIPAIAGTPLHSLASEHLEELFGITMNHAFRANDPDSTLSQSIKEYLEPRNFSLSTINIMVAGGLMRQVSNVFTKNENGNQTQSLARTIVEKGLEKQFKNNPSEDFEGITSDNYRDKLDTLSETEIDKLAKAIIDKEGKSQIERYNTLVNKIRNQLINLTGDEKTTENLINIYESFYAQKALETGESRYNIAKRFALEIKSIAEEKGVDLDVDNIVNEVYGEAIKKDNENKQYNLIPYQEQNYNLIPYQEKQNNGKETEGAETRDKIEEKIKEQENTTQNQSNTQNAIDNTQQIDFEIDKNPNNNTNNFETEVQKINTENIIENNRKKTAERAETQNKIEEKTKEAENTTQNQSDTKNTIDNTQQIDFENNKNPNNDTNNLNTEVQKINETETQEQKEIKELRNFIENTQNKNTTIDNWDYTLDLEHNLYIDNNTLSNTKTILSNYTTKSIETMTPSDWYDIQKTLENNEFNDYYINNNNKEIILDLNDKLVYLNGEDYKHIDRVIKFKEAKDRLKWEEENEALLEGKENRQAKTIDEIIEESKNSNDNLNNLNEEVQNNNTENIVEDNTEDNNNYQEVQKIDVPYKIRKSKDYRGANVLLATSGNYRDEKNNAVILNKNNAIIANEETVKNTEEFNQTQRTNTGKYPPHCNLNYIKYYLDNDIFKSYYFNDKNKTLLIELEDNVLITLSGEEYNYLNNVMVFSSPMSLNKYIEKNNYKSQTGAKTIAETRAKAKNVMGKNEIETPDIYNKLGRNEINIEDLIDKEENSKEFEGEDSLTTYALDYSRNKDKYKNSFFIFKNKDNNVNLIIDGNSIENSKLSKNKYLYPVSWEDIRKGLNEKNIHDNSSEYYLDKQNRKLVVSTGNDAVILSGVNYNYIESFKNFKDYRTRDKWLKDNYENDAKFSERRKPIADIVEEAKEEMGKGANGDIPNIYNKIGSNEIDTKDIDNKILKYEGDNLVEENKTPNNSTNNLNTEVQKTTYRQSADGASIKGQTHLVKNGNVILEFFEGKFDESTLIHETAHYFLLVDQALANEGNEVSKQHIKAIEEWTAAQFKSEKDRDLYMHERFARGYELYIRTGKYSNPALKESYDYFKTFLEQIYKNVEDLNLDVNNKQMYEFFDKYLYNPQKYTNWIYNDDDKEKENRKEVDNKTETKEEAEEDVEGNKLTEEEKDIKYDNSLSSLILKQSTENNEHLLNSIKDKIKRLTEEIAWQSKGKVDEESKLVKEKLLMKYFKERVKLLKIATDRINNETKETTETTSQEDEQKQEFIKNYQNLRQKDYDAEKEAKYADFINGNLDRIDEIGDQDPLVEEQKKYDRKIMQMAETLWNSFKTERKELENELLNRINSNRENLIEETERRGGDLDYVANIKEEYKPYNSVEEMLSDYEDRVKNKKTSIKDCVLMPSEYMELKNFIKKKLGGHLDSLLETIDGRTKALEEAQSKALAYQGFHDYALEKIDELKGEINKQKEFNEEFQKTLGLTPENLKTTMELTGRPKSSEILKEVVNSAQIDSENYETQVLRTLVNKLSNTEDIIKMIDTAKKHNKNTDYIINQINKNNAVETKKAIQNTMNNILRGTVSFNVKTGYLYGLTYYEDSGLLSSIKRYNRLSMKQAGIELFKLEEARKEGTNKDTQVEYELKRNMLYFRSTPATQLDTKDQLEMLESLSTFVKYSKERQNEVKKEQQDKLNTLKAEVKDAIKDRKEKMRFGLGNIFNLITTHFGNLPTQLEYLLGKDKAKLFDLYNYETSFKVNYKEKTDKLFTRINDILFENNKERDVEALFKNWNNPLTKVQPYKQDYEGNDSYRVVRLKQPMEKLVDRLLTELEMEKRDEDEDILFLKRVQNQAKKGSKTKDYRYNLPEYEFNKLNEIINKTKLSNKDILADNIKKSYNEIEAYDVNTWGLMYYHLLKQNNQTKNLIYKKYRRTDIEILDSLLGRQSKEFFDIANAIYDSVQDRNELNALYVLVFNRDMGYVENYFPRKSFHDQDFSIFDLLGLNYNNTNSQEDVSTISAVQTRSHNAIPKLNENPLLLALKHIRQTEFTKTVALGIKQFNDVFGDSNVRNAITNSKTEGNYSSLMNYMDALKNSYRKLDDGLDQILNKLIGNWAGSVTNTPSVFIKQISSIWAMMENQGGKEFTQNLFEGFKNPKQTFDLMMEKLPYLKVRFKDDENDKLLETLKNVKLEKENPILLKLNKIGDKATDFFRMLLISDRLKKFTKHNLTEYGDRVAVIFGGYARYKTLIDSGMSEQEAILNTEKQIVETQQSDLTSLKSKFMLDNSNYTRWAGMFKSQDRQYLQKLLTDYMRILTKDESSKKIAKNLILYHAILPLSMTIAQGIINALYGKKEKSWWEYTKMFGLLSLTSFFPMSLLSQSVILDFDMNRKKYENMFFTLQGAITKLPLQAYYKIGFDRYYTPSILNTEKKKKLKEKRRKKRDKEKEEREKKKKGW